MTVMETREGITSAAARFARVNIWGYKQTNLGRRKRIRFRNCVDFPTILTRFFAAGMNGGQRIYGGLIVFRIWVTR